MKHFMISILLGLLTIAILLIWPHQASAQGTVPYIEAVVDGTMGQNDWYVSDVSITWLIPPDMSIFYGCNTLVNQDTPPEGIELYCIVVDAFNDYYAGSVVIKRDATPPIVATNLPAVPPLALNEGDSYQVDASTSTDAASGVANIQWSLDGDGLFDDGNPAVFQAIDGLANAQANPAILVAQVIDQAGNVSEAAFPVVVYNLPPVFDPLPDIGPLYGPYNLNAPFSDPGILDTHTGSIDWGDDSLETGAILESNGSGSLLGSHTFERRGTYTLTLTMQDKDGAVITTTQRVNVVSTGGVSLPIAALFTNVSGPTVYGTAFNQVSPLLLTADDTQAEAILGLNPGGCIGILWFETGEADPQNLGPTGMCLTDPAVSAPDFNAWYADPQELPGPELHILLELSSIGPGMAQVWTNPDPLTIGVFVQSVDILEYQRLADLVFSPGDFSLTTGIDPTNRPYASLSAAPSLTNIDPATWDWIQTTFDPDDLLPAQSAPGTLVEFSGDPLPVIHDPDTLIGRMGLLQDSIGTFTYDGIIPLQTNLQLNQVLLKAVKAWGELRDGKALLEMNKFIDDVDHLVDLGQLSIDERAQLIGEAGLLIDSILDWQNPTGIDPVPTDACDGELESCAGTYHACYTSPDYITLVVDDDSTASDPDGSAGAPFANLVDALAYAETLDACGVKLLIEPGTYYGDLNITRHTLFFGQGNSHQIQIQGLISNEGPHTLELLHLNIIGTPLTQPTGVYANHPCARVILVDVTISGVYGYGIRQHGGSLLIVQSTVQDTKALPDFLSQGTGIYLSCSTRASLLEVNLTGNESSGLQVVGAGTSVWARSLEVKDTTLHPYWVTAAEPYYTGVNFYVPLWLGSGGVQVRDGGTLEASAISIHDNIGLGINVTSNGNARLTFADLLKSEWYCCIGEESPSDLGPVANAYVSTGGQLEIGGQVVEPPPPRTLPGGITIGRDVETRFVRIAESERCGVHIGLGGEVDLSYAYVDHNSIGVCIATGLDYDLRRIYNEVVYYANGKNVSSYDSFIPDLPSPDELPEIIDP